MEAVIFMGLQASGKSTLYKRKFFHSHLRISLDLLNTRKRESDFLNTCVETSMPMVIDNTNPSRSERSRYLTLLKKNRYRVVGYYFESKAEECMERNARRSGKAKVLDLGIFATLKKLERPSYEEGFDELLFVSIRDGEFVIEPWITDEV